MPKKKRRIRAKHVEEYAHVALRVESYKARVEAALNHYAHNPEYAFRDTEEEPLYHFLAHLEIAAIFTFPEDRADQPCELTIYGEDHPESSTYWKLKDVQKRDEHRTPVYRTYRGKDIPVYLPPKGMGVLERARGESRWRGTLWGPPRFVTDLLLLLAHDRTLFLSITERKLERHRWIQSVTLQTTDPAEE
jgi:hypothetical protein